MPSDGNSPPVRDSSTYRAASSSLNDRIYDAAVWNQAFWTDATSNNVPRELAKRRISTSRDRRLAM